MFTTAPFRQHFNESPALELSLSARPNPARSSPGSGGVHRRRRAHTSLCRHSEIRMHQNTARVRLSRRPGGSRRQARASWPIGQPGLHRTDAHRVHRVWGVTSPGHPWRASAPAGGAQAVSQHPPHAPWNAAHLYTKFSDCRARSVARMVCSWPLLQLRPTRWSRRWPCASCHSHLMHSFSIVRLKSDVLERVIVTSG
jgi:hypothetical protein